MAAPAADAPVFSDDERNSAPDEDELVAEKEILNEDVPDVRDVIPSRCIADVARRRRRPMERTLWTTSRSARTESTLFMLAHLLGFLQGLRAGRDTGQV